MPRARAQQRTPRAPAPPPAARGPVAGVDEAGRGPVLGPLVVAGVLVDDEAALRAMGVKDSKKLAPAKREALAAEIRATARKVVVRVVEPAEIDRQMGAERLSEVAWFAEVVDALGADEARLDAADVNAERFGAAVAKRLARPANVYACHKADDLFPCVSAASIVAKVERDRIVAAYADEYGEPVGSGYSHDAVTRAFLAGYVARVGALPRCARAYWVTSQRLVRKDRTLIEFVEESSP